jgi:hypothetical protein
MDACTHAACAMNARRRCFFLQIKPVYVKLRRG